MKILATKTLRPVRPGHPGGHEEVQKKLSDFVSLRQKKTTLKRATLFCAILLLATRIFAQDEIISTGTAFITQNRYDLAESYLDSILKKNPRSVDAMMMKGNVLLNYAWQNTSKNYFNIEKAESVFDTSAIDQTFFTPIIPEDTSRLIEKYWRTCLSIDSSRTDIRKGLCNLLSISLRTDDLKKELRDMQGFITAKEDNAFLFAEYARNVKARGKFDEGMQIYQLIADMFPGLAGIRCDMSAEYFYAGRLNDALRYLDSALSKPEVDQTTFIDAAAFYSLLGYYDKAWQTFQKYSEKDTLVEGDFYKGLVMFANMDSGFYNQLQLFLKTASEQSYVDEVHLAQKLLPFGRIEFTMEDYRALVENEKIPRYYRVLILQRGVRQFKDKCEPFGKFGVFECSIKNYSAAQQFLEEGVQCATGTEQAEQRILSYGFAWYQTGEKEKALQQFEKLFNSGNNFVRQSAQYFGAKIYLAEEKKDEAKKLFTELTNSPASSKHSWLAKMYRLH